MKVRTLTACAPTLLLLFVGGCGAILGIPGDVERADTDSGRDALAPGEGGIGEDGALLDAPVDAPVDGDAGKPDVPLCDSNKELAAPVLIASVSTAGQEGSPRLSDDELTMYFDAQRGDELYFDIYVAQRTTLTDSFGAFTSLGPGVNTTANHEFAPNVSSDGLTIFFERKDPLSAENSDFYVATRPSVLVPFGTASPVSGVNTPFYESKLFVRGDGSELYFVKKGAQTSLDLHVAKKVAGNYVISRLANVNSAADEYAPVISPNGLVLYFSSERPFAAGRTDENIWVATRAKPTDDFGLPTQVLNVNSLQDDEPSWISSDGCRLYMISNRPGGAGGQDIYVATRPK